MSKTGKMHVGFFIKKGLESSKFISIRTEDIYSLFSLYTDYKFEKNRAEVLLNLKGRVSVDKFITQAEDEGWVKYVDEIMLENLILLVDADKLAGKDIVYHWNLSVQSIENNKYRTERSVLDYLEELIKNNRLDSKNVCIEITEREQILDSQYVIEKLYGVRALGVEIAFDDYGAGLIGVKDLHSIRPEYLKIDGSFIKGIDQPYNRAVVESFITLAKITNSKVIAEHVETMEQLSICMELGIRLYQGFFIERLNEDFRERGTERVS